MSSGMELTQYPLSAGLYTGKAPWHMSFSNSTVVDTAITLPMAKEFLNWEPVKVPVTVFNPANGMPVSYDDTFITGRVGPDGSFYRFSEKGKAVSDEYGFLPNADMLNGLEPWLEADHFQIESLVGLFNGATVLCSGRVGDAVSINGDELRSYLCVYNTHNGQGGGLLFTTYRVDCNNMLQMAISGAKREKKILTFRHGPFVKVTYDMVCQTVDAVNAQFIATTEQLRFLQSKGVKGLDSVKRFQFAMSSQSPIETALQEYDARQEAINKGLANELEHAGRMRMVEDLYARMTNADKRHLGKTHYDLLNAMTDRLSNGDQGTLIGEDRFGDNLFGNGARAQSKALNVALAMAQGK